MLNIESIIFYILLLDSIIANILVWFYPNWFKKRYRKFYKHFPITKGWCALYLILVLWIGFSLYRLGLLNSFLPA